MPSKVSSAYRSPKPQPLYTDPTIGAGAANLGALIFGDPAAMAKRALDEKHGKYYEAGARKFDSEAGLHNQAQQARAGLGGRLAQLNGVPQPVAEAIASMVQGGGINDTSIHAAQTLNTVTGGQMMRDTVAPQAPGAPAPNVNAVEQLSRVAAMLMNGGTHLPTEKNTLTPNYQDAQLANAEDNANYRQEYASDSSKAGVLGSAKIGADQRERSERYKVDNTPVNAGPGHVVTTSPNSAFGGKVFTAPAKTTAAAAKDPVKGALDESKLRSEILGMVDGRTGTIRDKQGKVTSGTPLAPLLEQEIAGRASERVRAGATLDEAFTQAWAEVVGDKPLGVHGGIPLVPFDDDNFQTPGGVPSKGLTVPPRSGPGRAAVGAPAPSAAKAASVGAPTVNSQAEFDALAPGTQYRDSAGNLARKP